MNEVKLDNIFPPSGISNKDWCACITNKIGMFTLEYYKDKLDPTISYSNGGHINIYWNPRKNSCVGTCRRIPRIIAYNESKINDMNKANVLHVVVHECAHLIYDGHGKEFSNIEDFIFDKCIENLEKNKF
jgi:hypothetical protein